MQAAAVRAYFRGVGEAVTAELPHLLPVKKENAKTFLDAIIHMILKDFCHGDIKVDNVLHDEKRFHIADLGGSKIISELIARMNSAYRFNSEQEKIAMQKVVVRFSEGTVDEAFLERNGTSVARLAAWGMISLDAPKTKLFQKKPIPICGWHVDQKKLQPLREYLNIEPFPSHTKGYGYSRYIDAVINSFWRCEPENYKNACHALDIRAAGLTVYIYFTADHTPKNEQDAAFYDNLEAKLRAKQISEKAISIIRRMAEPMKEIPEPFTLPVKVEEIQELIQELT